MKKAGDIIISGMPPVMWPELESNQRHKDFQSSPEGSFSYLWLPQINQSRSSLQGIFNFFHDLLTIKSEQRQPSVIGNYG
jgi:hypothetical protein